MSSKISVIIPIYKVEAYLRQCLDSVVNQTYRNLEIILIDDGSPDNCGKICDEYAERDDRIIVIHKENGGLSAARNDGIKKATGKWLAFVDSDDWCELDYYETLVSQLGDESMDVLCANGCRFEFANRKSPKRIAFKRPFRFQSNEKVKELAIKTLAPRYAKGNLKAEFGFGSPWDKIYKTSFIRTKCLQFDVTSKGWEDIWFNFQVFDKAEYVAGCICAGYHYRMVNTSIMRGYNPNKPYIAYDFIAKLHDYFKGKEISSEMMCAIRARSIMTIVNAITCYYFHPENPKKWREVRKEIEEMVQRPYFHEAIYSISNRYLTIQNRICKDCLRLNWGGLLLMIYRIKKKLVG